MYVRIHLGLGFLFPCKVKGKRGEIMWVCKIRYLGFLGIGVFGCLRKSEAVLSPPGSCVVCTIFVSFDTVLSVSCCWE